MDFSTYFWQTVDKRRVEQERRVARLSRDNLRLSAQERQAIKELLQQASKLKAKADQERITKSVLSVASACARTNARRTSDRNTDHDRRTLVGARVKREDAERYRRIAQDTGRSLYRFVVDALEEEARRSSSGTETQDVGWEPLVTTIYPSSPSKPNPPGPPGGGRGTPPGPGRVGLFRPEAGATTSSGTGGAPPPPPVRA